MLGFAESESFILKWVPKEPNDSWKHINTYGPKFTRGPDLAT